MKKLLNTRITFALGTVLIGFLLVSLNACKKESFTQTTTGDVNITGYLENDAEQFSLMSQVIKRSGAGYLAAYGTYTLFVPTNDAITAWLKTTGKATVADVPVEDLKKFVNFHLIVDTIGTQNFIDGKIRQLTAYGQFLTSSNVNEGGNTFYLINKQGKIIKSNIRTGNGIIHVVDKVLTPQLKTLSKYIEDDPRYSFFSQALKETGLYDVLNVIQTGNDFSKRFRTVILESDSAIKAAGYPTYAALKAALSKSGNPKSPTDSLWLYVAYHTSTGANYLNDVISNPALSTLAPSEIVSTKLDGQTILLNEIEVNKVVEAGSPINRTYSDITTANGVIHEAKTFYKIKFRVPTALCWDVADTEVIRDQVNYGRGQITLAVGAATFLSPSVLLQRYNGQSPLYTFSNSTATETAGTIYNLNDYYQIAMTDPPNNNNLRTRWMNLRTPVIIKGTYKVWICYPVNATNGGTSQVIMDPGTADEQVMSTLLNNKLTLSGGSGILTADLNSDNLMLAQGYKRYMAVNTESAVNPKTGLVIKGDAPFNYGNSVGRLVGVVNIRTTDRHWIKFDGVSINQNGSFTIDMIHFIPVEKDQQYPRFSKSGTAFNRP